MELRLGVHRENTYMSQCLQLAIVQNIDILHEASLLLLVPNSLFEHSAHLEGCLPRLLPEEVSIIRVLPLQFVPETLNIIDTEQ
jgi:hypothetical protein